MDKKKITPIALSYNYVSKKKKKTKQADKTWFISASA